MGRKLPRNFLWCPREASLATWPSRGSPSFRPSCGGGAREAHPHVAYLVSKRCGACRRGNSCVALVGRLTAGPGCPESRGPNSSPRACALNASDVGVEEEAAAGRRRRDVGGVEVGGQKAVRPLCVTCPASPLRMPTQLPRNLHGDTTTAHPAIIRKTNSSTSHLPRSSLSSESSSILRSSSFSRTSPSTRPRARQPCLPRELPLRGERANKRRRIRRSLRCWDSHATATRRPF